MFISLGSDCSITYNYQKLGLKTYTYPFDWIKSNNFENILSTIKNNFEEWYDESNYICIKESEIHPYIEEDFQFNQKDNLKTIIIENKINKIKFYHDLTINNDIISIINKYRRRINRFYETLNNNRSIYCCIIFNTFSRLSFNLF